MMLVTTPTVPGHDITAVYGLVCGSTIVSTSAYNEGLKSLADGKLLPTKVAGFLKQCHDRTFAALITEARTTGANAVVGVLLGSRDVSASHVELYAYGTAVTIAQR